MAIITLTFAGTGNPALINTDWVAYAHEEEGPQGKNAVLKLGSPHMEILHVSESLAQIREIIEGGTSQKRAR